MAVLCLTKAGGVDYVHQCAFSRSCSTIQFMLTPFTLYSAALPHSRSATRCWIWSRPPGHESQADVGQSRIAGVRKHVRCRRYVDDAHANE